MTPSFEDLSLMLLCDLPSIRATSADTLFRSGRKGFWGGPEMFHWVLRGGFK